MAFRIFLGTPHDGDTPVIAQVSARRFGSGFRQREPEIPRISFHDGKPGSDCKVNPEIASEGPACFSGLPTEFPRRLGFPKFNWLGPLDEILSDPMMGWTGGLEFGFRRTAPISWGAEPT